MRVSIKKTVLFLFITTVLTGAGFSQVSAADENVSITGSAGTIIGTIPVIQNASHDTGKINISKDNTHDAGKQLDVGDTLSLSWQLEDSEGDTDATTASTVWTCNHPQKGLRVLATHQQSYTVSSQDLGCSIGVSLQPQTSTGSPRANVALDIPDISTYDQTDNIIDGPVNSHAINITDYIVAPGTTQSKTVTADIMLETGWDGAKVQIETDNLADQVNWKSSDEDIATVSSAGIVTFKSKGDVTISASNEYVTDTIRFNPEIFFIFDKTGTKRDWADIKTWCTEQGYRMATGPEFSTAQNKRSIPSDSLWQEWGNVAVQGVGDTEDLYWTSTVGYQSRHQHAHVDDGYIATTGDADLEASICVVP